MSAASVSIVEGPAPYREALAARLESIGLTIADSGADALVIFCSTEALWDQAADSALWTPTVVVIPDLDLDAYVRALALGAGAVHLDTSTAIIADVVVAVVAGEALLPLAVTQALASHQPPSTEQITEMLLEGVELQIVEGLVAGLKLGQIASVLGYSDRTIRRKLQGIYLKLGVEGKTEAMKALQSRRTD